MNASTEAIPRTGWKARRVPRTPPAIRIQTRLHRGRLDHELVSGADPDLDPPVLLADGAGPLYGNGPSHAEVLVRALEDTLHAIDNGPGLDD
jgi:hypothetical protein